MELQASGRDLFLRYQGTKSNWVECHRIWGNSDQFFKEKLAEGVAANPIILVSLATETEYRKYKGYKQP